MDYAQTTQAREWTFTAAQLATAREANCRRVLDKLARGGPSADGAELPEMLSVDDEVLLQRCWHYKLQDMCREETARTPERFTPRVMATAHAYQRRFFLRRSLVEDDPRELLLAAVYLAAKVEEERIELHDLTRYSRLSAEREAAERGILANEEKILATLGYQLVVRSPFRALSGLLASLSEWGGASEGGSSRSGGGLSPETLFSLEAKARELICRALCGDAPLLFSPQQLALAGLCQAAAAAGFDLGGWLQSRVTGDAMLDQLQQLLDRVGAFVDAEGGALDAASMARCKEIESRRAALSKVAGRVDAAEARTRAAAEAETARARKQAKASESQRSEEETVAADATQAVAEEGGVFAIRKRRRREDESRPPTVPPPVVKVEGRG